jgi:hypothetical protein
MDFNKAVSHSIREYRDRSLEENFLHMIAVFAVPHVKMAQRLPKLSMIQDNINS